MTKETVLKRIEKLADYFKYALITGDKHAKSELEGIRESVEALQTIEDAEIAISAKPIVWKRIGAEKTNTLTKRQQVALAMMPMCEKNNINNLNRAIEYAYEYADRFLKLDEPKKY